jgi:hypothetical protein
MRGNSYYEFNSDGNSCRIYGNKLKASHLTEVKVNNIYFLAGSPNSEAYVYKDNSTQKITID